MRAATKIGLVFVGCVLYTMFMMESSWERRARWLFEKEAIQIEVKMTREERLTLVAALPLGIVTTVASALFLRRIELSHSSSSPSPPALPSSAPFSVGAFIAAAFARRPFFLFNRFALLSLGTFLC